MGLNLKKKAQDPPQETEQKPRSRKAKSRKKSGVMVVAALVIVLALQFRKRVDTVSVADGAYQYFGEQKLSYSGKTTIHYEDGQATLKDSSGEHVLDHKPLYTNDQELILPVAYAGYDISSGRIYRLEHFSTVTMEGNQIVLKDGDKKKEGAGGFIYDGQNTYLFLERAEVTIGEQTVNLPAMSYVVSQYGNTLQYYAVGSDKSVVIQAEGADQIARFGNGDVLNLGTDTLNKANGSWQLLVADPSIMDRMD